jgi:hypothetical protein
MPWKADKMHAHLVISKEFAMHSCLTVLNAGGVSMPGWPRLLRNRFTSNVEHKRRPSSVIGATTDFVWTSPADGA